MYAFTLLTMDKTSVVCVSKSCLENMVEIHSAIRIPVLCLHNQISHCPTVHATRQSETESQTHVTETHSTDSRRTLQGPFTISQNAEAHDTTRSIIVEHLISGESVAAT